MKVVVDCWLSSRVALQCSSIERDDFWTWSSPRRRKSRDCDRLGRRYGGHCCTGQWEMEGNNEVRNLRILCRVRASFKQM